MAKLDNFTIAYLKAALFTSTDATNPEQGGVELDENYGIEDIATATLAEMVEDCRVFQDENAESIQDDNVAVESPDYGCDARAGHDFWMTRTGQGCGYWDGDWIEPAAGKLDSAAQACGEYNITASGSGDDQVEKM